MKQKAKQFLAMFLAVIMVVLLVPVTSGNSTAYAEDETAGITKISYNGNDIAFVKDDLTSRFGMFEAQDGTTCEIDGDNVVIHYVPKNTTVYGGLHWGAITDTNLTKDVTFNTDGTIDLTLSADKYCGYAHPVAPIKKADEAATTKDQYYLAIPAKDKLPVKSDDADYTAVDAAIAKVPADLSIYTDETAAAVTAAVNAVVRDKPASEQAEVDAMAKAIEDAITALVKKSSIDKIPYDGNDIKFVKEDLTSGFGMFAAQDGTTCEIDGDNVVIHFVPKNTTVYGGFHWGAITDTNLTKDVTFNTDGTIDLTLSADKYCGYAHPIAPIKKADEAATTKDQYYLAIPAKDKLPVKSDDADYTAVDAAIAKVPADLSIYTDETAAAVTAAVNAVVRDKPASEQAEVDAMAKAIEDAVAALKKKESGEDPTESKKTSLYPVNDEAMFKVVNAFLETKDGKTELVFALSSTGYKDVIPATYEEALAMDNKDAWASYKEAEVDCKYTARGTETDEGVQNKYQFRVPVKVNETGKTKIPMISVSARERDNAEKAAGTGKPDYSKAFMARQFIIDMDSKELHTGNYQEEMPITVTSEIETFKVEKEGVVSILGCPPANEYEAKPTITLSDQVYDKAFIGKAESVDEEKAVEVGKDGKIKLDFINSRSRGISLIDGTNPITVAFHVKETGEWIDREFVMDLANKKITITGEEIKTKDEIKETPANYNKVNEAKEEAEKIDNELFTEDSIRGLSEALSAVEENLTADKQKEVNEMADNINAAMKKLKLKDGVYTIPANSLGNDFMDVVIEVEGGKMSAYVITTSRAQDKICPGTKEEAENGGKALEKLGGVKNSQGMPSASMFRIPLDAINDTLEFAVHSPDGWTAREFLIKASDIKKGEYKIIENANGKYTLGETFTVASDADFSKFVAVIVDDELVAPTNYSVASGSTRVTFKGEYTKALGEKSHEVQILSHDGIAKTTISGVKKSEAKPAAKPTDNKTQQSKTNTKTNTNKTATKTPKTGDDTNAFAYAMILIVSMVSVIFVYRRKQR